MSSKIKTTELYSSRLKTDQTVLVVTHELGTAHEFKSQEWRRK